MLKFNKFYHYLTNLTWSTPFDQAKCGVQGTLDMDMRFLVFSVLWGHIDDPMLQLAMICPDW